MENGLLAHFVHETKMRFQLGVANAWIEKKLDGGSRAIPSGGRLQNPLHRSDPLAGQRLEGPDLGPTHPIRRGHQLLEVGRGVVTRLPHAFKGSDH